MSQQLDAIIAHGLDEIGVCAAPGAIEALAKFARLLESWGDRLNLTGHRGAESVARRLILDAAALQESLPPYETLADLGSGAGLPGLPMAILEPTRNYVLVEARERRYHFLRHALRELELTNAHAIRGRFEEVDPVRCDAVIAQAVAAPSELAAVMLPWANPEGFVAVPGGTTPRGATHSGLTAADAISYRVPLGGAVRSLWIGRVAS